MGQTVNLLAYAFDGSNPSLPTIFPSEKWSSTGEAGTVNFRFSILERREL